MENSVENHEGLVQQFVGWPAVRMPAHCGCAIATTPPRTLTKYKRILGWAMTALLLTLGCFGIARRCWVDRWMRSRPTAHWIEQRSAESALARLQIAQAEFSRAQSHSELLWSRRHQAWDEWTGLDATARVVYAALSGLAVPASAHDIATRLADASGPNDLHWEVSEISAALSRLRTHNAVARLGEDRFQANKPDWVLLPEVAQPLAQIIARAAQRIGNYRVAERIGVGATGVVFRAVRVRDGMQVALKMVRRSASANPETRRRLEREGDIVSTLSHPNIVRLLERGEFRLGS